MGSTPDPRVAQAMMVQRDSDRREAMAEWLFTRDQTYEVRVDDRSLVARSGLKSHHDIRLFTTDNDAWRAYRRRSRWDHRRGIPPRHVDLNGAWAEAYLKGKGLLKETGA